MEVPSKNLLPQNAVNEYELLKKECIEQIKQGISSPIAYYMYDNRMDLAHTF